MDRVDKLHELFKNVDENKQKIVSPLIDEAIFIEGQLQSLKEFPFIKSREVGGVVQTKQTPAGKQYREYLQTYTNIIDKLCRIYGKDGAEEESPLQMYFKRKLAGDI